MQITAACPNCKSRYQFDAALVGQRIRCTNAKCREIFEVREVPGDDPPRPGKPVRDRKSPTFDGDSSEHPPLKTPAMTPSGEGPREADWSKLPPPPVRRRDEMELEPEIHAAAPVEPAAASADEVLAFMGMKPGAEAPPDDDYSLPAELEAAEGEPIYEVAGDESGDTDYEDLYAQYGRRPKKKLWLIAAFVALLLVGAVAIGGSFVYMGVQKGRQEGRLAGEATQSLSNKNYKDAERRYDELLSKYVNSKQVDEYRFWRDYARNMGMATDPSLATAERYKGLSDYIVSLRGNSLTDTLLKEKYGDLHNAFTLMAEQDVRDATRKADAGDFDAALAGQASAVKAQGMIRQYAPASGPPMSDELTKAFAALAEKIADGQRFATFMAKSTEKLTKELSPTAVSAVEAESKELGYALRPSVTKLLDDAKKRLLSLIVFRADERPAAPLPASGLTSLIIGPNTDPIPENSPVIFAVARGVIYAIAEGKGQILWAARVGIDASALPLRVPAAGSIPALVLLPAPNGLGLVAREVLTGKTRWFQRLDAVVRGRPILVEGRIIAPLADDKGTVAVLESRDGQMQGKIELNQRIGAGAALQPGTSRVFVPAESQNVFVLDANPPLAEGQASLLSLVAVLATNHGPGSLRAEPTIVGGVDEATGQLAGVAYMIIAQSDGFSDMKLRSFELPLPLTQAVPRVEVKLPGWAWFAPFCDQEKVATVTDAGALALLGINQKENQDPTLFPLVVNQPKERTKSGRGQIVHAEENGFWYLANGEMNFMRMGFHGKDGLKLAPGWKKPLTLGAPLHAAQVSADRNTLFVVTQMIAPPAWMATAVNAQTGDIVWQRSLGLAVSGDPVQLGDQVYQLDQGAGVYAAQPGSAVVPSGQEWALAGQVLAASRQDVVGDPYLLPHADGKMAFCIFATGDGKTLNASVLVPGQKASAPVTTTLPAPLAGIPLLMDKTLLMPLADGGLHKWVIGEKDVKRGPDWRAPRLGETARSFVTRIGKDGILVSDGSRGLTYYAWPNGSDHQLKQQLNVPDKIIAAPVALPVKDGPPRIAVADAAGRVSLLEGDPLAGTLKWEMRAMRKGNEITAGPYLVDAGGQPRLLVVTDRTTLVCLTPEDRREAWVFKIKGDGLPLAPRQVGNALILSDVSGRYEAIDVSTGQPLAGPYPALTTLPAAPAASPVTFGSNLFAPLTDGTVLLIPVDELTGKK